jgi:CheY-like chemotaxis protein
MPDHEDSRILPLHRPPLVLVVAENADHRSGVTRIVRKLGFSVRECACAEAAWAYLDRRGDARPIVARRRRPGRRRVA